MKLSVNEGFLIEATVLDNTENTSFDISDGIQSVLVKENYIENSFPLFIINFQTTREYRDILMKNNVEISLKVNVFDNEISNLEETDSEAIYLTDTLFEVVIRPYDKPFIATTTKTDEDNEDSESNDQDKSVPLIFYQVSGIPKSLIKKNSKVINKVFERASMNDILINILSDIDSDPKYIESADNVEREDSILIPPMNPIPAIKFLQETYGIYKDSLILYFGVDKTFCCSAFGKRTEENNFNLIVKSSNSTSDDILYSNVQKEEGTNNLTLFLKTAPTFSTKDALLGDELGTETIFYSYDDNFNLITSNEENRTPNSEKVRYFWNSKGRDLFQEEFKNLMKKRESAIMLTRFIRPTYFSPLTNFIISGEEKKVNGEYSLMEKSYVFSSIDKKHFSCDTSFKLIKKK